MSLVATAPNLDLNRLFARAWKLFSEKPFEHIVAGLVVVLLGGITIGILLGPLLVGYIRLIERQQRGEPIAVTQVFDGFDTFGSSLGALILAGIGIAIGCIFLVIPGLILAAGWGYAMWFVALRGAGPVDALGSSWRLFRANLAYVLVVEVIVGALNSLGSAVLLGALLAFPFGMILMNLSFNELTAPAASSAASTPQQQ